MNPNNPDPNNPNSGTNPVQPDLGSALPGSPLPDPISPPPMPPPTSTLPDYSQTPPPLLTSTPPTNTPSPTWPTTLPSEPPPTMPTAAPPPLSPLDNPLGVSSQPPAIDSISMSPAMPTEPITQDPPAPTFIPTPSPSATPTSVESSGFSWSNPTPTTPPISEPAVTIPSQPASPIGGPTEPAPTDLSHLVSNSSEPSGIYVPPISQPETLVTPPNNGGTEIPNVPTENQGKGIPKWVIGVGVALLLVVVGASAYFILGVGKTTPQPESTPATETNQQTLTPPPLQVSPLPAATPTTGSDGFGTFPGGTQQATSAADLLKKKQGQ